MPAPALTTVCTLDSAYHENGIWYLRATVVTKNAEGAEIANRSGTNQIEGPADMTDAALKAAILNLYA